MHSINFVEVYIACVHFFRKADKLGICYLITFLALVCKPSFSIKSTNSTPNICIFGNGGKFSRGHWVHSKKQQVWIQI